MDVLDAQPIINEPALFIQDQKTLVVADLHIGIESELIESGVNAEPQTNKMIDHLVLLCKKFHPKKIILLGDIKHNIPSSTIWERKDVKNFLQTIEEFGIIYVLPGNHDGNIKKLISEKTIVYPSDGCIIGNIGFVHGHRWPSEKIMQCEMIVMAHSHPTVMFTDRRGFRTFESCWLKAGFIKDKLIERYPESIGDPQILVMPAFNPLCGGTAVNKEGIVGPIGKMINIDDSQVYLLDGSFLGRLKDIQ